MREVEGCLAMRPPDRRPLRKEGGIYQLCPALPSTLGHLCQCRRNGKVATLNNAVCPWVVRRSNSPPNPQFIADSNHLFLEFWSPVYDQKPRHAVLPNELVPDEIPDRLRVELRDWLCLWPPSEVAARFNKVLLLPISRHMLAVKVY